MIEQYSKTLAELVEADPTLLDSIGFDLGKDEYNERMKKVFYNMYMDEEINFINETAFISHVKATAFQYSPFYKDLLARMEEAYIDIYKDYETESKQINGERVSRSKSNSRPLSGNLSTLDNVADYMGYNKEEESTNTATATGQNSPKFKRLLEFKNYYMDLYTEFAYRFNIYFSEVY